MSSFSSKKESAIINQVLNQYGYSFNSCHITPLGNGLINQTYLVQNEEKKFVLQKLNQKVFKRPQDIIVNTQLIHNHLSSLQAVGNYSLESIGQLQTVEQKLAAVIDGEYWRGLDFIENSYTIEAISNPHQATQAATAFAKFNLALRSFPSDKLIEILPNFHNINARMQQLEQAIQRNASNRLSLCLAQVKFCQVQHDFIEQVNKLTQQLPINITHNDTKINNLLFNQENSQALAVIDLDTCMPGYLMHDFGDMVRTCCTSGVKDITQLDQLELPMDILTALFKSYVETLGENISAQEKQSLIIGSQLMPLMLGIRFLTDYINGDTYFATRYEQHNFDRACLQLKLFGILIQKTEQLQGLIPA